MIIFRATDFLNNISTLLQNDLEFNHSKIISFIFYHHSHLYLYFCLIIFYSF
jgi:hypothetical protein